MHRSSGSHLEPASRRHPKGRCEKKGSGVISGLAVNAARDQITLAAFEQGELRRVLARHIDSVDKRRLLGVLAAEPDRGFPLPGLLKYVRADQLTLVLFMDELECARLVQVVRVDMGRGYRLAPVAGLAEMVTRLNRAALDSFNRRLSPIGGVGP